MNELNWLIGCLILVSLLPYLAKIPLAWAMFQQGTENKPGYDNREPRIQQKQLKGFGARCLAAHENSFEALILFTAATLLTITTEHLDRNAVLLALAFASSRVLYLFFYWLNWDKLRSSVWLIGMICVFAMMFRCMS